MKSILLEEQLRQILSQREISRIQNPHLTQAAVLVPLYQKDGAYHLLFTKRTAHLRSHKGQISFPGGRYQDEDQSLWDTALRESHEEIGLKPEDVGLLGILDDITTFNSGYVISPFVGTIPYPYPFRINPFEVEFLLEVPLSALRDESSCQLEFRFQNNQSVATYAFSYKDHLIWGATARILKQFLDLLSTL